MSLYGLPGVGRVLLAQFEAPSMMGVCYARDIGIGLHRHVVGRLV